MTSSTITDRWLRAQSPDLEKYVKDLRNDKNATHVRANRAEKQVRDQERQITALKQKVSELEARLLSLGGTIPPKN